MIKRKLKRLAELYRERGKHKNSLRWMADKTRPYIGQILLMLLLNLALTGVSIGTTLINKTLIDDASGAVLSTRSFVLLALLTILSIGVGALTSVLSTFINERYAFGVRAGVYSRVLGSKWQPLSAFHSGDMMTRLTSDIDTVAGGISSLIPSVIHLLVRLCASFIVLYHFDPFLALSALALGPVGVVFSLAFTEKLKKYQEKLKDNESRFRAFMQESVANITVVKTFQQEGTFSDRLLNLRSQRLKVLFQRNIMSSVIRVCISLVFSGGYLLAFFWGIRRLALGEITYGTMSVFLSLVGQVQSPIMQLSQVIPQFINVLTSAGRVIEIDTLPAEDMTPAPALTGGVGVRFEDVSFAYDAETVLSHVTVDIRPGETIGLIGTSGAGKTTMARLILALCAPGQGSVTLYDQSGVRVAAGPGGREYIGYVPQGNTLISGTIRENLLMGMQNAADSDLWEALRVADAGFVRDLPKGLDTPLSERAGTLSEGQAQRLAIARALLRRRPILILDEATASLDIETEKTIVGNLRKSAKGLTCIVITHRPSLLDICQATYKIDGADLTTAV